jgi:hypothetical protein
MAFVKSSIGIASSLSFTIADSINDNSKEDSLNSIFSIFFIVEKSLNLLNKFNFFLFFE